MKNPSHCIVTFFEKNGSHELKLPGQKNIDQRHEQPLNFSKSPAVNGNDV